MNARAVNRAAQGLIHSLDEAFAGPAWHGPALRGALQGVTPAEALWRPSPDRHCIWELALHAAYWKYVARRRIAGGPRGAFSRKGSNFPRLPDPGDAAAWQADLDLLEEEHARLRDVVASLRPSDLDRKPGTARWTVADTIRGVALHDIYHAGQIQLLKRLQSVVE